MKGCNASTDEIDENWKSCGCVEELNGNAASFSQRVNLRRNLARTQPFPPHRPATESFLLHSEKGDRIINEVNRSVIPMTNLIIETTPSGNSLASAADEFVVVDRVENRTRK